MNTRNKWAVRISGVIAELECLNGDPYTMNQALEKLDAMLLEALEPLERKVYHWIVETYDYSHTVTSPVITEYFGLKQNHASMVLSNLCQYGLLSRTKDITGNSYIYKLYPPTACALLRKPARANAVTKKD